MDIMRLTSGNAMEHCGSVSGRKDEDLQREYNYHIIENLIRKMLESGIITVEESDKISKKNRERSSPELAPLMTEIPCYSGNSTGICHHKEER